MIELREPNETDEAIVRALFRDYPYRSFQQRRQGIDPDDLSAMLWEGTLRQAATDSDDLWLAVEGQRAVGLGGLVYNAKHSELFERKMGRVQPFVVYPCPDKTAPLLCEAILERARERGYRHLSCRVDGSDTAAIQRLESQGFYFTGSMPKLARRLATPPLEAIPAPEGLTLDELREGDREALARIAAASHEENHFFSDPALRIEDVERLFREWVERCCDGLARHVFVAREAARAPAGFAIFLGADGLRRLGLNLIVLDFICVDRERQGRGVGRWLLSESLRALADRYEWVELRTDSSNYPALALYTRLGFEIVASDVMLHLAIDD